MQKVKAFVVLNSGVQPSESTKQSLIEHCEQRVAKFAAPREYEFVADLPKTALGKIDYETLSK
jgi:acyl-coenzyme A synthetase/AMP-(fatty) acid ligase